MNIFCPVRVIINYKEGDTIQLKSINLSLAIEQVYRGIDLTSESESTEGAVKRDSAEFL
jgi:hypothetical protein